MLTIINILSTTTYAYTDISIIVTIVNLMINNIQNLMEEQQRKKREEAHPSSFCSRKANMYRTIYLQETSLISCTYSPPLCPLFSICWCPKVFSFQRSFLFLLQNLGYGNVLIYISQMSILVPQFYSFLFFVS